MMRGVLFLRSRRRTLRGLGGLFALQVDLRRVGIENKLSLLSDFRLTSSLNNEFFEVPAMLGNHFGERLKARSNRREIRLDFLGWVDPAPSPRHPPRIDIGILIQLEIR